MDDGSEWVRLYIYAPSTANTVMKDYGEALNCYKSYCFSKLDELNRFQSYDGYWEFILTYPDLSETKYNRWKQFYSPYSINTEYIPIHEDYTGYCGALRRYYSALNPESFFKCDPNTTWFAPIGVFVLWDNNSIPAADGNQSKLNELWARIDNL